MIGRISKAAAVTAGCVVIVGTRAAAMAVGFIWAALNAETPDPLDITPYDEDLEAPL